MAPKRVATVSLLATVVAGACGGDRAAERPEATTSASPAAPEPSLVAETPRPQPTLAPELLEKLRSKPLPTLPPEQLARWQQEMLKVEEERDRGERLRVPPELRHYRDTRRFLAVQVADARARELELPADLGELAAMYERGEVVELAPIGEHHVLYDVGTSALEPEPEDPAAGRLAERWGLDLSDPKDRRHFQVRLLSTLRPAARDVVLEIARAYHERYERLLPISSMIRTIAYQQKLTRVNPNATKVVTPPHTTGMAFDISYRYMPPAEVNFLSETIAPIERAGRVEALLERRGAVHVYVLRDGPPSAALVARSLKDVDAARAAD